MKYKIKCPACPKVFLDNHPPREQKIDNLCPDCEQAMMEMTSTESEVTHEFSGKTE